MQERFRCSTRPICKRFPISKLELCQPRKTWTHSEFCNVYLLLNPPVELLTHCYFPWNAPLSFILNPFAERTDVWESLTEMFCDFLSWSTAWRRWKRGGRPSTLFHSAPQFRIDSFLFSLFQISAVKMKAKWKVSTSLDSFLASVIVGFCTFIHVWFRIFVLVCFCHCILVCFCVVCLCFCTMCVNICVCM